MIWVDYAILVMILISSLIGLFRGLIREAFSIVVWLLAIWVGLTFCNPMSVYLDGLEVAPSVRIAIAFFILLIATLVVGALLNFLLTQLIESTGLTGTDRFLGLAFGIARGVLIVSLLILFAGVTPLPQDPWWRESVLIGHFQPMALWMRGHLPPEVANYLTYQ